MIDISGGGLLNRAVSNSLKRIRAAKSRIRPLASGNATQAALMSQIELCNILLDEIRSISSSLEKRVETCAAVSRRPVAIRRHRGAAHRIAKRPDVPGRSKQRK